MSTKHPIHQLARGASRLMKAVAAAARVAEKEGGGRGDQRRPSSFPTEVVRAASMLDRLATQELSVYRETGSVSQGGLSRMRIVVRTVLDSLPVREGYSLSRGTTSPGLNRRFTQIGQRAGEVARVLGELKVAIDGRHLPAHDANSSLEEYRMVRRIWGRIARDGDPEPTVAEFEGAMRVTGVTDLGEPGTTRRIGTLIRAMRLPQTFELRYRSTLPGRPWVLMMRSAGFPNGELIERAREQYDWNGVIYVAATEPTWHIVWQFK